MHTKMTPYERFMSLHPAAVAASALTEFGRHMALKSRLRRDRQLLSQMSDQMLSDIGISRHEINSVTSPGAIDAARRLRG